MVAKSLVVLTLVFFVFLTLVPSISLATQCGNLKVKVVECDCGNPISDAKVCVEAINVDPCGYTNSNGEILFQNLVVGDYSVQASKDGYDSNSAIARVECFQTTEITICLNKIKVCSPGEIRNRGCICPTQVTYEKCKDDGSGWETIIENCPEGYVCESGYCVRSRDGWYDTGETRCNLYGASCGYGTKEMKQEYRDYTCFGSTCTYVVTQVRWVAIGSCSVPCTTTTTTVSQERDGWYDTGREKCEMNGFECGLGRKMKEQEYRDYTCFGVTCTYQITAKRWIEAGTCYQGCPTGYSCINGYCRALFDCNNLDGWYRTGEERCVSAFECGIAEKQIKEEYRDYYSIVSTPTSPSDCSFVIKDVRWNTIGNCYLTCPNNYYCTNGLCVLAQKNCEVKIWVKEEDTNLPIANANVCFSGKCYLTDSNGLVSFYVNVGSYDLQINKEGYVSKSITITCQTFGNPIYQTVALQRIKACFDCNLLDGWYYTTEAYCEVKGLECGKGILLRKEEYRDYYGTCVDSPLQCKNYKVISYRWIDDGICEKGCSVGICEEGVCKKSVKLKEMKIFPTYLEYEHPKKEEAKIDLVALVILIASLLLFILISKRRVRRLEEDC